MSNQVVKLQEHNFSGGLVTDYTELNEPDHVTRDEDNVDFTRQGSRRRRLGLMPEPGFQSSAESLQAISTAYYKTFDWLKVANRSDLDFLVVQFGNKLAFFDKAVTPLSTGEQSFSIDLNTFAAPGVSDTSDTAVAMAYGKGYLFIVGAKIEPFYVKYNDDGTITSTKVNPLIRDFTELEQLNDTTPLANDAQPTTITDSRLYDLYNQGWGYKPTDMYDFATNTTILNNGSQPTTHYITLYGKKYPIINTFDNITALDFYLSTRSKYPPKTKPWFVGKRVGDKGIEYFAPSDEYDMIDAGNTLAALGHFLLNPFSKDRASISGITSLGKEVVSDRPTAVAFHAGRVFFARKNIIYYSQVIEDDITVINRWYQQADPTSERVSDLVATDGGMLIVANSGDAIAFFQMDNMLLFFSNNGVWSLSGASMQEGFSATGFSITKICNLGAVSQRSIVSIDGVPAWWSTSGIYHLQADAAKFSYRPVPLLDKKMQLYYNAILPLAKQFATGAYDTIQKRLIWLFNDGSDFIVDNNGNRVFDITDHAVISNTVSIDGVTNRFFYNKVLNFDVIYGAFFPYTISDLPSNTPYLVDVFNVSTLTLLSSTDIVYDNAGNIVKDNGGNTVFSYLRTFTNTSPITSNIKYMYLLPHVTENI